MVPAVHAPARPRERVRLEGGRLSEGRGADLRPRRGLERGAAQSVPAHVGTLRHAEGSSARFLDSSLDGNRSLPVQP
jgi:hypothetical protein